VTLVHPLVSVLLKIFVYLVLVLTNMLLAPFVVPKPMNVMWLNIVVLLTLVLPTLMLPMAPTVKPTFTVHSKLAKWVFAPSTLPALAVMVATLVSPASVMKT
jgi:hypothetical protein